MRTKIEVTSSLIPILNVGIVDTELDPDYLFERHFEDDEEREEYFDKKYDFEEFKTKLTNEAREYIKEHITPWFIGLGIGIVDVEVVKIKSPNNRYHENDMLFFDLIFETETDPIEALINKQLPDDFEGFLKRTYFSYDGFSSAMPKTIEDWQEACIDDKERAVSAYITYYLTNDIEIPVDWKEDFVNMMYEKSDQLF